MKLMFTLHITLHTILTNHVHFLSHNSYYAYRTNLQSQYDRKTSPMAFIFTHSRRRITADVTIFDIGFYVQISIETAVRRELYCGQVHRFEHKQT